MDLDTKSADTKKAGIARFSLSPRLLPAAGTFMVGEPSIGSNTIAPSENLTSYPEGYFRTAAIDAGEIASKCVHIKAT